MTATNEREFLRPVEIAKLLGVGPQTVRNWIESGELEGANIAAASASKPRWITSRKAVEDFYQSRLAAAPKRAQRRKPLPLDYDVPDVFSTL